MSRTSLAHRYRSASRVADVLDGGTETIAGGQPGSTPTDRSSRRHPSVRVSPNEVATMLDSLAALLDRHLSSRADPKVALRVPPELLESLREQMRSTPELARLLAQAADDLRQRGSTAGPAADAVLAAASVADAEVDAVLRRLTYR